MKLLVIAYHYPLHSVGALRPRAMEKYLPRFGVEVAVVTHGRQGAPLEYGDNVISVRDRPVVGALPYLAWRAWQKLRRIFNARRTPLQYWSDNVLRNAEEIMSHARPDAILASYPPIEALQVGLALASRYGIPLINDFRDGLLFESVEAQLGEGSRLRQHFESVEAQVMKAARLTLTVSDPLTAYFRTQYGGANAITLHNGYDPDDVPANTNLALPTDAVNIVYTGRLGGSREGTSIAALLSALQELGSQLGGASKRLVFHFVGELSRVEQNLLMPLVRAGNAVLCGHQPHAVSLEYQRKADVLLLITAPGKTSIATGKLFEYLAAGRPILALTEKTEAERIIVETGAGWVVPPDDAAKIGAALRRIAQDPHLPEGQRRQDKIAEFSRERQMQYLAEVLSRTVNPARTGT